MKVDLDRYMSDLKMLFWRHEDEHRWPYYMVTGNPLNDLQKNIIGVHPWIMDDGEIRYEAYLKDYNEKALWLESWGFTINKYPFLELEIFVWYITEDEAELGDWEERATEIHYKVSNGDVDVNDIADIKVEGEM